MRRLREYSKRVIRLMIILWFLGAAFGAGVVAFEVIAAALGFNYTGTVHLPELLAYIGAPVGGGILGYLLKSAFENKEKIKKGTDEKQTNARNVRG